MEEELQVLLGLLTLTALKRCALMFALSWATSTSKQYWNSTSASQQICSHYCKRGYTVQFDEHLLLWVILGLQLSSGKATLSLCMQVLVGTAIVIGSTILAAGWWWNRRKRLLRGKI